MLENLTERLSRVVKTLRGEARLTESNIGEALREVRMALLEADVALPVVKDFIAAVREKALGQAVIGSLTPGQALVGVVHRELTALMGGQDAALDLAVTPPAVILMAGLQGAGKTTTVAKLARLLRDERKKKILLVSCDVYRPAAIEQLKVLAAQAGVDFFPSEVGQAPLEIALASLDFAKKHYHDVLLVDTAGRLAIDEQMMREIAQLHAALKPAETLFVADSMTGQDAVNSASEFDSKIGIDGVVLTKMDGDSRGGAALSIRHVTGKPIKFMGTGEKIEMMEVFHPDRVANRILGMGDVLSLIEKAERSYDADEAMDLQAKFTGDTFSFEDLRDQLVKIKSMGSLESLLSMIPGLGKQLKGVKVDEGQIVKVEAIINSMTPRERRNSALLNGSRRKRIALGSGTSTADVNKVVKQYKDMKKMMKMMKKGRMPQMPFM